MLDVPRTSYILPRMRHDRVAAAAETEIPA